MKAKYRRIAEATLEMWDMDQPIPRPVGDWPSCGVCGHDEYVMRNSRWFMRPKNETGYPYRVDVSLKCIRCGFAWVHGLIPHKHTWEKWVHHAGREVGAKYNRYQLESVE